MKSSSNNSNKIWYIGELFTVLKNYFISKGVEAPQKTVELIFSQVLNLQNSSYLYISFDKTLSKQDVDAIRVMAKRRVNGEPIEYITNSVDFYGNRFKIDSRALIPRPETEIIVDKFFEFYNKDFSGSGLDLCCGSGIIGITLKKLAKNIKINFSDISNDAITLTKENCQLHTVSGDFIVTNGLSKEYHLDNSYDFIVSNPPYIKNSVIETLDRNVKDFEPHLALDGGEDGLDFYRDIKNDLHRVLKKDSIVFFEYGGFEQTEKLIKLYSDLFEVVEVVKDFNNIDRVIILKKC